VSLEEARGILAGARRVAVLTGVGISAESGVPTFRGPGGLWKEYRPEDLATPEAFHADPRLVWEWYEWRRGLIAEAKPNKGHEALVALEQNLHEFALITQNVDGLHRLAGSVDVLEIHGSLWRTRCLSCGKTRRTRDRFNPLPPHCACGGLLRPDVVWFGESIPPYLIRDSVDAANTCDVMLVVGTSGLVQPAAALADVALNRGVTVIEVNLEPTPLSGRATFSFQGRAGEILPRLIS
jgi:NAD-dependent deacetylase